ncbi:DUF4124 domain-containing protein [Xylophilus sp. GOD-11R]|uniref:DUF4124 domain-containing protein n=1 Tax=Xylophilus sp. GOD-11R TaxID=3089814 RepID=UPI00298CFE75|nr:DUF4124 domain-containing protein [Xylophilus sp. GOD-11R]WPB58885.1 DUF4124 domain-containing protein [Xylophilus sp. GOD-11R]
MTVARFLIALTLACTAGSVAAQFVWLDKTGRKVYSDRPPPIDVPERSILKQPGGPARSAPAQAPAPAPTAPAAAPGQRPPGQDGELADRRRQQEAAEKAKAQAEETKAAAARADNCQRAQQSAAALNSGVRIATLNAAGERSYMDDQTRAAEAQRAQSIMASDCR